MKRLFVLLSTAVVFLVPSGVTSAAGPKDYAKGSGVQFAGAPGERTFSFNAWSDPANNDPQGSMKFALASGLTITAEVTCLSVIGRTAAIWGDITKVSGGTTSADGIFFWVRDSGDPSRPDTFSEFLTAESVRAGQCTANTGLFPIDHGDITVLDE